MNQPDPRCFFCERIHDPGCERCGQRWCAGPACRDGLRARGLMQLERWTLSYPPAQRALGMNPSLGGRVDGRLTVTAPIRRVDRRRVETTDGAFYELAGEPADFFETVMEKCRVEGYLVEDPLREFVARRIIR